MARGLDAVQKAELVEFLEDLYRLGGYETQAQWARDAGYHPVNLSNALNRTNADGMDAYSLLRLMRAAATRAQTTPEVVARRLAADDRQGDVARRLQALEETVETAGVSVTQSLDVVAEGVRKLEHQLEARGAAATKKKRTG